MAAYDGESVYALAADLDAEGELRDPGRTGINRLRLSGASYWQLLRTRRRLTKYAERGIACDGADEDWLAAEMAMHVRDPSSLLRACAYGRLQEACALIRAGANHRRVTGAALRVYNPAAPCFHKRVAAGVAPDSAAPPSRPAAASGLSDFRALLEDYVAEHASPRSFAARASAAAARVSKGFAGGMSTLDPAAGCIVARFVSGFTGGSLNDAYAGERAAAAAASSAGARRAATARVKAIKRALPPLAKTDISAMSSGYGDDDDDDDEDCLLDSDDDEFGDDDEGYQTDYDEFGISDGGGEFGERIGDGGGDGVGGT